MTTVDESVTAKTNTQELAEFIGCHISYYRQLRRLTQAELAVMLGLAKATVSSWGTAKAAPSIAGLVSVAEVLAVPPAFLLPYRDGFPQQEDETEVLP